MCAPPGIFLSRPANAARTRSAAFPRAKTEFSHRKAQSLDFRKKNGGNNPADFFYLIRMFRLAAIVL